MLSGLHANNEGGLQILHMLPITKSTVAKSTVAKSTVAKSAG